MQEVPVRPLTHLLTHWCFASLCSRAEPNVYVCVLLVVVSGLAEVSIEVAIIEGYPSLVRATLARLAKHRPHEINQYYVSRTPACLRGTLTQMPIIQMAIASIA